MSQTLAISAKPTNARQWDVAVLVVALLYFALRAGWYALNIAANVPPDEKAHFAISEVFAKTLMLPSDSPESYRYGLVTHGPSLYYYLMGRAANVNFISDSNIHWLRCTNVLLGMLTVVFGYLWMRLFTTNAVSRALFGVIVTNIPMFTLLSASVSYDNLANMFAAASIYFLTLFFAQRRGTSLGLFALAILLGSLSKYTSLPLAAVLLLVLLVHERRSLSRIPSLIAGSLRPFTFRRLALPAAVLVLTALVANLYAGNLIRYRRLVPNAQQVLTLDQCMQNPVFARDYIAQEFRQGRMTLPEALKAAGRIDDDGIKAALAEMLNEAMRKAPTKRENSSEPKSSPPPKTEPPARKTSSSRSFLPISGANVLAAAQKTNAASSTDVATNRDATGQSKSSTSLVQYAKFWAGRIAETTFRILAQPPAYRTDEEFQAYLAKPEIEKLFPPNPAFKSQWQLYGYGALFLLALVMLPLTQFVPSLRRRRDFGLAMNVSTAVFIVLSYSLLLFWVNFNSYTTTGLAALAVQGRYLFPVLVPTYGLASCLLVASAPKWLQGTVAAVIAAWFLYGDFPFYLESLSSHWFA